MAVPRRLVERRGGRPVCAASLRAESVAWVTERKDVLSGVFFSLTLWAYAGYARNVSLPRYLAVASFFALGLLAKPMLVTLPILLLLLDYWPLGRFFSPEERAGSRAWLGLVVEKLPLLAVAAAAAAVSLWAQGEARVSPEMLPLGARIGYALVSYVQYLGRLVDPVDLAVLYPRPMEGSDIGEQALLAAAFLGTITAAAVVWRRQCPYLLVGWLWYLGMLFPVSGVLPFGFGAQWTANRFTYLPQIGLALAAVWAAGDLSLAAPRWRWAWGAGVAVLLAAAVTGAWCQTFYWRDSETLWRRAIACTHANALAHYNLGRDLAERGEVDAAIAEYLHALGIRDDIAQIHFELGLALERQGRHAEAIAALERAVAIYPDFPEAQDRLRLP